MRFRKNLIITSLLIIFTLIAFLFWHNEVVYSLPTPVPKNYQNVSLGNKIELPGILFSKNNKPVFLHFFNPDCPCSRFNIAHFKSLVKHYSSQATFAIVVMNNKNYTAEQIREKFELSIPVLFDNTLAGLCGVYSTPQAVIIDNYQKLYYRGNYNRSRYCTDKNSNYAQQALDSLLNNDRTVTFNHFALKAYGCQLPNCTK